MSEHIEIEFKNLLQQEEFKLLIANFGLLDSHFITQHNHYFDTIQFDLKNQASALRIREKEDHFELTLKQPREVGLLETTQSLTLKDAKAILNGGPIVPGPVMDKLLMIKFPFEKLVYFGSLTTKRAEVQYKQGLLVLDQSIYLDTTDYEIEYEVEDVHTGRHAFENLLHLLDIPLRNTENKIKRFYNRKIHNTIR